MTEPSRRKRPLYVYDNWSAYDELSDNVLLTEELALFELGQVKRLMAAGVQFDAYLMDAFWYSSDGGYREWRRDRWPQGPGRWLGECAEAGLLPGLWFPANTAFTLDVPDAWRDSLASDGWGFCCFSGGFLKGFIDVLDHWYRQGVRVFKFDFADFGAAPDDLKVLMLPSEIRLANVTAYRGALAEFRRTHPGAWLLAYNGFEEAEFMPWTDRPLRRVIDPEWLTVFDSIYCGDPRPADVPLANFWRTLDVYADHETWYLNQGGLPLNRIDNCAMMLGRTGTCYWRGIAEWRTTALLSYARAGRVHVAMGNLEALDDADAGWLGKVQRRFEEAGEAEMIGGRPGAGQLYGYRAVGVTTYVNPGMESVRLEPGESLIYGDGATESGSLAAGGVAVFGPGESLGEIARPAWVAFPVDWLATGRNASAERCLPPGKYLFGFRQVDSKGLAVRSSTGSGRSCESLASHLRLSATVDGQPVPTSPVHDHVLWSGISWALATFEVDVETQVSLMLETLDTAVASIEPLLFREQ